MNKQEFIAQLRLGLCGLPQDDIDERLMFYSEMIADRMEEGLSEEEAVCAVGTVDEIVAQIIADTSLAKIAKERIRANRQLGVWEIVLLALGSPIWLALAMSAIAVVFSLYVSVWAVIISLWAVFGSLAGCSFAFVVAGVVFVCNGHVITSAAMFAAGLVCSGLCIFAFCGCRAATKGIAVLTKMFAVWIKNCFIKKEVAQ